MFSKKVIFKHFSSTVDGIQLYTKPSYKLILIMNIDSQNHKTM